MTRETSPDPQSAARPFHLALLVLLWSLGFALLECAYFTRVNHAFPLGAGHVALVLLLTVQYAAVGILALLGAAVALSWWREGRRPLLLWIVPWSFLLLLLISHYRDRVLVGARTSQDLAITAAIIAGSVLLLFGIVRAQAGRSLAAGRRVLTGGGFALVLGGAAWLATARPNVAPEFAENAVPLDALPAAAETGLRVLLVGTDGGEWSVMDPLIAEGRLPNYASLAARGRSARLQTIVPTFSPIIWTSVATGKVPEKHRISSHVYTSLPFGLPAVAHDPKRIKYLTKIMKYNVKLGHQAGKMPVGVFSSRNLRARQLWDIMTDYKMSAVSLEWYITHPVRPIQGLIVSDRFHLMRGTGRQLAEAVYPESLAARFEPAIVTAEDLPPERLLSLLDVSDGAISKEELQKKFPEVFRTLSNEMARDLTLANLLERGFAHVPDWRLGAVYYRAMDGSHHMTWKWRGLPADDLGEHPERRFRNTVDAWYQFCDELLGRTIALADERTVVIVLSDHGWENQLYGHARKPAGIFLMAGGPVLPASERGEVSIYDVAPTVLALLGIPVPEDMDGRVLEEFIDPAFWQKHPVRTVPSYERPRSELVEAVGTEAGEDQILQQLETLGYVGN
jgi:hypothetical protein